MSLSSIKRATFNFFSLKEWSCAMVWASEDMAWIPLDLNLLLD